MLDEVVCRLAPVRANNVNETSDVVKGSLGSKRTHLFKCHPTDRACALKVALLGVGAGEDGVALDPRPQVRGSAELDRPDRELLSLAGAIEVTEAACEVAGQSSLIEVDPRGIFRRVGSLEGTFGVHQGPQARRGVTTSGMRAGLHGRQHRCRSRRDCGLGARTCRAGKVKPMPHIAEMKRLVAHCCEDAAAKRPVTCRVRHPQRLGHVALGVTYL